MVEVSDSMSSASGPKWHIAAIEIGSDTYPRTSPFSCAQTEFGENGHVEKIPCSCVAENTGKLHSRKKALLETMEDVFSNNVHLN